MLLTLLAALALGIAAQDTDADGRAEWTGPILADADNDGTFDQPAPGGSLPFFADTVTLTRVWTSGSILNNQWDAYCGYFDDDSLLDILGHHWNPNMLHVFESDGAGGYNHVWEQTESLPPGSYCTVTAGDPDDDGELELLGGEVSTLGKVVIFENTGDNSWGEPYRGISMRNERIRTVRVGDTNDNDTSEVIIVTGDATAGGKVAIFEHTGPPGVHSYTRIYEYTTVSYLFQAEIGDADNDGYPEILLGVGGWHGYPMNIRRIVYDPVSRTYSHQMYTSAIIGLPVAPMACDADSSGGNELVIGSSGETYGQLRVFRYAGGDSFSPVWTSNMTTAGNVIAVNCARFAGYSNPLILAAPFGGAVYGFENSGGNYRCVSYTNPGTGSAIRSVDYGYDVRDELILAESAPADYISVYRRDETGAVSERPALPNTSGLRISPNPCRGSAFLSFTGPLDHLTTGPLTVSLFDASGRRVLSQPVVSSPATLHTSALPAGVYVVVLDPGNVPARLLLTD